MTDTTLPGAGLSRRGLLKVGLFGSAFLATAGVTASLSGCSASVPASGLATLRSSDLPFLRALIPVVLAGAVKAEAMPAAVEKTIAGIDFSLEQLQAVAAAIRPYGSGFMTIYSSNGMVLGAGDKALVGKADPGLPAAARRAIRSGASLQYVDDGQVLHYIEPMRVGNIRNAWAVRISIPLDSALAAVDPKLSLAAFVPPAKGLAQSRPLDRPPAIPARAKASARSFSAWPAWPLIQRHVTSCAARAASSLCQRSTFLTEGPPAVRQPLRFQLSIHSVMPFLT